MGRDADFTNREDAGPCAVVTFEAATSLPGSQHQASRQCKSKTSFCKTTPLVLVALEAMLDGEQCGIGAELLKRAAPT